MQKRIRWWIGAVVMFALIADTALFLMGGYGWTITAAVKSDLSLNLAPAIFYFVLGGLFVHFTNWR